MSYQENNDYYSVVTIDSYDDFLELRESWNRLFNCQNLVSIFFSFDFFRLYYKIVLESYENIKIKIFLVKNKDEIIGIFPFLYEKKNILKFFSIRSFSLIDPNRIGFYFFLVDQKENVDNIYYSLFCFLNSSNLSWNLLSLYHVPFNDIENLYSKFKLKSMDFFFVDEIESETLVVNVDSGFTKFIENDARKKAVMDVRRCIRRLEERGNLSLVEVTSKNDLEKYLSIFFDIENQNWKGKVGSSMKKTYQSRFYKEIALFFRDSFHLFLLKVDDTYISGLYTLFVGDVCYLIKAGYDESFYRFSPSTVLIFLVIEKLCANDEINKIDFFGPYYHYERKFGSSTRQKKNLYVYNNDVFSKVLFFGKNVLSRFGLLEKNAASFYSFKRFLK